MDSFLEKNRVEDNEKMLFFYYWNNIMGKKIHTYTTNIIAVNSFKFKKYYNDLK